VTARDVSVSTLWAVVDRPYSGSVWIPRRQDVWRSCAAARRFRRAWAGGRESGEPRLGV